MPQRWCQDCGNLFDKASTGTQRCPSCQATASRVRDRRRVRPSSAARGYGQDHRASRAEGLKQLEDGSPCVRCHHPMWLAADKVQLDHNEDRTGYIGFSHGSPCQTCGKVCNQVAGGEARQRG